MLVDFTVENYRSIKNSLTLSAVAQGHASNEKDDEVTVPYFFSQRNLKILPVLGIFGANASGKSNLINALGALLSFTFFNSLSPTTSYGDLTFATPFKLDREYVSQPSKFEFRLVGEGHLYIFHLELDQKRVLSERLSYVPATSMRAVPRLIYQRNWNAKEASYSLKNGKDFGNKYLEIQSSLSESQLFLSLLTTQLRIKLVTPLTDWLHSFWTGVSLKNDFFDRNLACLIATEIFPNLKTKVKAILQNFDTGIYDLEINRKGAPDEKPKEYDVSIIHNVDGQLSKWPLEEESLGTQKLFDLSTKLFYAFERGGLMLVDELGLGTHPHINREIIRLFQNRKINTKGAQLIFTSHDSTLLKKGLLRRDQIWFVQKSPDHSTDLYSLSDFGARLDLVVDRAYLDGRFGGLPFLPHQDELTELLGGR